MAKQRGPVASTFSGRVGNVVGAKLKGGEYVTRSYQPSVKNPNTLRQRVSRLRMATAAQLAAGLAPAIMAGFGKASSSTKMYPRNMFVRNLVKNDANSALDYENDEMMVEYNALKISERFGISTIPAMGAIDTTTADTLKIPITGQPVVDVLPAGKMGVVIAAYDKQNHVSVVNMFDAPTDGTSTLEMPMPATFAGITVEVYAFFKWIPQSGNDIATSELPWKYPSETGATVYVGNAIVG